MIKFPSKYPIVVSAMNQVSYAKFAVHCYHAGLMPSISVYNAYRNGVLDYHFLEMELLLFSGSTHSSDVIISCSSQHILEQQFLKLVDHFNLKYFEFIDGFDNIDQTQFLSQLRAMQQIGCKFFVKVLDTRSDHLGIFDGIILKGNEGAGRSISLIPLKENFKIAREKFPKLLIIPSGGIYSKEQVDYYLENGAPAVSIGTLFVASHECRVSMSLKDELVKKDSSNLTRMQVGESLETQQGLVYGFVENDDDNHTFSLNSKVLGKETGVIFAGKAIDHITKIRPLSEIVSDLV